MKNSYVLIAVFLIGIFNSCKDNNLPNSKDKGHPIATTLGGKRYAAVLDIQHLIQRYHSLDSVKKEMRILKELGFNRVYFILCNPGYPAHSSPFNTLFPQGEAMPVRMTESVAALGDPNQAYMSEAKRLGMEAWAVIKPYESGTGNTIPHGKIAPYSQAHIETIGGSYIHFDNLLSAHPELAVQRKPLPENVKQRINEPVKSIEIAFCIDPFTNKTGSNNYLNYQGIGLDENINPQIELWVSKDNGIYNQWSETMQVSRSFESRPVYDANRVQIYPEKRHLVLKIDNLNIGNDYKYFALVVRANHKLYTIPYSMIKIFTATGEIPVTIGLHARYPMQVPGGRIWGMDNDPVKRDFTENLFKPYGFEFEWCGSGFWGNGWESNIVYAAAKGVRREMKGTPCEAYPEVRTYWLDMVKKAVDMGFDGIDLRLMNHSAMVADYFNYGYNTPIVNKYREKYGVDILQEEADPEKIMRIRGDYYQDFLTAASEYVHSKGKLFQVHLIYAFENPILNSDFNQIGFWSMPKIIIDWKKAIDIADEVTLKHYYFNNYDYSLATNIKEYAKQNGKRVWIHDYIQLNELNETFLRKVEEDTLVGGVLFYDFAIIFYDKQNESFQKNIAHIKKLFNTLGYE